MARKRKVTFNTQFGRISFMARTVKAKPKPIPLETLIIKERVGGMSRKKVAAMFGTTQSHVEMLERKLM